jgi:hypothetical protein
MISTAAGGSSGGASAAITTPVGLQLSGNNNTIHSHDQQSAIHQGSTNLPTRGQHPPSASMMAGGALQIQTSQPSLTQNPMRLSAKGSIFNSTRAAAEIKVILFK